MNSAEDFLAAVIAKVWHLVAERDRPALQAVEREIRNELGSRRHYVARPKRPDRGDAYREARARGLAVREAAERAGISPRHARRLEQRGHHLP